MSVNLFDANFYRAANSDLAGFSNAEALSHFQTFGLNEGRAFSPFVNLNLYRASNSDLASFSNQQAFEHLQTFGVAEGRRFSEVVDLNYYRAVNSDLASFNNEALFEHLRRFGVNEERQFSTFFDIRYYQASNSDLGASGLSGRRLLNHFEIFGLNEGRQFSNGFDVNYYRNTNADLVAAGLSNKQLLEHFQVFGVNEGRASTPFFNVSYYLANNSDLVAAGFNNQQAYNHFTAFGLREGRLGNASPGGDYAGNDLFTARNITPDSTNTFRDFVGSADTDDFYLFSLDELSNVSLSVNGLRVDADVVVFQVGPTDENQTIASSANAGTAQESLNIPLDAGTYYVQVYQFAGDTSYNLNLSATAFVAPPDAAGNTLSAARDIGTLNSTPTFSDFVGSDDTDDFYRFSLSTDSSFSLLLDGLSADADVDILQDVNGDGVAGDDEVLLTLDDADTQDELLSTTLTAGTYFVRVYAFDDANTNYNLTLSPIPQTEAIELIGLTRNNTLVSFDSTRPDATQSLSVTGVAGNLLGIDYRSANGLLYGLTDQNSLYTINASTGAATLVSTLNLPFTGGVMSGLDFNPAADRLRLVGSNDQNFRINVDTGAIADFDTVTPGTQPDGTLAYAAGDRNFSVNPNITAAAYTNSFIGSPNPAAPQPPIRSTTLYDIDYGLDVLVVQNPPNNGGLTTVGSLGIDFGMTGGFDIYTALNGVNTALAASNSTLYTINLTTGAATSLGKIGSGAVFDLIGLTAVPAS